jgi:helicase required for RNAi-mediated heterochromatin assembly 1
MNNAKKSKLTLMIGLTKDQMMRIPETPPINLGLPMEESDIEYEQIEELEEEANVKADGEKPQDDSLNGIWVPFNRKFTGRHSSPPTLNDKKIKKLLTSHKNLLEIPVALRGEIYRFFEKQVNIIALRDFRTRLQQFEQHVNSYLVTKVSVPREIEALRRE